jgi:hypothetical protein
LCNCIREDPYVRGAELTVENGFADFVHRLSLPDEFPTANLTALILSKVFLKF